LWDQVIHYLKAGYSPEQIAGTLALVNSETPTLQVSHETIYTAIYAMPRGELRTEVIGWLRFGHAKRRPHAHGEDRRGQIPDMVSIHDRPPEVEERLVPGHWEGDLIKGAHNRSAVGTLVERTTLFTMLSRMDNASAEAALSGFSHVLNRIEAQKRLPLTYDQGREMAAHQRLAESTVLRLVHRLEEGGPVALKLLYMLRDILSPLRRVDFPNVQPAHLIARIAVPVPQVRDLGYRGTVVRYSSHRDTLLGRRFL